MKRYYIADVIGTGTVEDPYRTALHDAPHSGSWNQSSLIPIGPDGRPTSTWALVIYSAGDHGPVANRPGVDPFPDGPPGQDIAVAERNRVAAFLRRRGLDEGPANAAADVPGLALGLARQIDPAFNLADLDVVDG